jgi:pSer/pThr/pTyr-binding forkhead associated (FHA) protein/Zn-dependent protease with chaperone function
MTRSWLIGSSADCDVIVNRPAISGLHCRLTRDGDEIVLEDLRSTDGTFVNGGPIDAPTRVTPGDAITLGASTPLPWPAEAIPPGWQILRIGRNPENDFPVDSPNVSGAHARLIWNEGTREAIIEDLGSSNGTAVGSPDRKASRSVVSATDTVYLGTHAVPASELLARLAPPRRPTLTFRGRDMILGRDSTCDHVIPLPMVSGRHARLTRSGSLNLIEDLGSANGTSVNGQRIDRAVAVKAGDIIGLGTYLLELAVEDVAWPETAATLPSIAAASSVVTGTSSPAWRWAALAAAAVVVCLAIFAVRNWLKPAPPEVAVFEDPDRKKSQPPVLIPTPFEEQKQAKPESQKDKAEQQKHDPDQQKDKTEQQKQEPDQQKPRANPTKVYDIKHLTAEDEAELGRELHELILRYHPEARDTGTSRQRLGAAEDPLLARAGRKDRITYTILDSDTVNAFSHVGGYIYVSWALFAFVASEEELQFILAHEIAHLERKHAFQSLAAENQNDPPVGTAQRLYHLIAQGYNEQQEFEADDRALALMIQLRHSRRRCLAFLRKYQEYAADHRFPDGLQRPRSKTVDGPQDVANHLAAHPAAWKRLKRLEAFFDRPAANLNPPAAR